MRPTRYDVAGFALLTLILVTALGIMMIGYRAPLVLLSVGGVVVLCWLCHVLGDVIEHDVLPDVRKRVARARAEQAAAQPTPPTPTDTWGSCSSPDCRILATTWKAQPHPANDRLTQAVPVCPLHST